MTIAPGSPREPARRFHEMDALRATAMLLGILYHVLFTFFPWLQGVGYYCADVSYNAASLYVGDWIHGFRMELFYVIGGFFAHLVYERYGRGGFLRNRARRILLPFVISAATLVLADNLLQRYAVLRGTVPAGTVPEWQAAPMYLWFLYYMVMMDVGTLCLLPLYRRVPERARAAAAAAFRWLLHSMWSPVLLCVPAVAVLMTQPPPQFFNYVPVPGWLAYFGLFFAFGFWLYDERERLSAFVPRRFWHLGLATAVFGAQLALKANAPATPGVTHALALAGASVLFAWLMVFGGIGFFVSAVSRPSPGLRYLADASYWTYLIHWPILTFLQITLAPQPLPALVKIPVILAVTLGLALVSYRYVVRYTAIGTALNGPRQRPAQGAEAVLQKA